MAIFIGGREREGGPGHGLRCLGEGRAGRARPGQGATTGRSSPYRRVEQLPQLPAEPWSRPEPLAHGAVRVPDLRRPLGPRPPPPATVLTLILLRLPTPPVTTRLAEHSPPSLLSLLDPVPAAARSSDLPAQWRTRPPSAPHPAHAAAGAGAGAGADTAGGTTFAAGSGTLAAAGQPLAAPPLPCFPSRHGSVCCLALCARRAAGLIHGGGGGRTRAAAAVRMLLLGVAGDVEWWRRHRLSPGMNDL